MSRSTLVRSASLPDQVEATVTGTVNGQSVTYEVKLDIQVVPLPGQFGGADDVAIAGVSLADGYSVAMGGPYVVKYIYRGKVQETPGLWGDDNGQLVAGGPVRPF